MTLMQKLHAVVLLLMDGDIRPAHPTTQARYVFIV